MVLTTRRLEQVALGNAMRWGAPLRPAEFHFPPHPDICRAILAIRAAGLPVALTTVTQWLRANDLLEHVGGPRYIAAVLLAAETR